MSETMSSEAASSAPEIASSPDVAYHFGDISPAEATAINDGIDIVAYGCLHGVPPLGEGDPSRVDAAYQAAIDMVATLDPARGDVLFVESAQHQSPWIYPLAAFSNDIRTTVVEQMRASRMFHPFSYVVELASLKGVPILPADMNKEVAEQFEDIIGEPIPEEFDIDWSHLGMYQTLRNEQTANTVKDYARAALPTLGGQKPTYAILMGPGHIDETIAGDVGAETITDAFSRLGLQIKTSILPNAYDSLERILSEMRAAKLHETATHIAPLMSSTVKIG